MRVRLGASVLDTELRQLTRSGTVIPLSPKAFRLLEVLAERQPRAVAQAELRALVWPELQTGGTTLARLIYEIRSAIGDEERPPRFVRTVPRFGYALSGAEIESVRIRCRCCRVLARVGQPEDSARGR